MTFGLAIQDFPTKEYGGQGPVHSMRRFPSHASEKRLSRVCNCFCFERRIRKDACHSRSGRAAEMLPADSTEPVEIFLAAAANFLISAETPPSPALRVCCAAFCL